ncbi:M15 family metallopeptidase [Crocinitomix catalasitica]|uniref:M15 family metallopeptidase n=1 Tax=Crocinitomix catalasitica TaxID=184607 RepID=UPI000482461B|nr:M15 family metallopeptidase [Crocinitomix catalasitica]
MTARYIANSLFSVFILNACVTDNQITEEVVEQPIILQDTIFEEVEVPQVAAYIIDTLEQKIIDAGLVDIQSISPDILIDVRYSDTNNFMHRDVYGHLNRIYLQPTVAEDLGKSQLYLKSIDSTLTLLVYDGVRPRSVQQYMWDVLEMPIHEKTKFVSNPKNGSLHNYGAAVDLTIADAEGNILDMGAGYDDIRKIAYPRHEKAYLDSGLLSKEHIANRELLREVMKAGGFWNIETEWWHFNRYSRDRAKTMFEIVE